MSSVWQRPASAPVPTVWSRFNGLKAMADGRVPAFWVQDVRPEDEDAVIAIMENHFLREEVMSAVLCMADDPAVLVEVRALWRLLMQQQLSLAAWTDWPDGTPRLVGCNVTGLARKGEPKTPGATEITQKLFRALESLGEEVDVCEKYGVDRYLTAMGLSTLPEFRGQGLGLELLRARVPLCRAVGIPLTATVFTGIGSQKQSARAGFELLAEQTYADYKHDGEAIFSTIDVPTFQYKALLVPPKA